MAKYSINGKKKPTVTASVVFSVGPNEQANTLPDFRVPTYRGERLNGDKRIRLMESILLLCTVASFLTSDIDRKKQTEWSGAFSSRIRSSL